MGLGLSKPVKSYYDIKPKDILFPEDDDLDDDDLDDLPHDLQDWEVGRSQRPRKLSAALCMCCLGN